MSKRFQQYPQLMSSSFLICTMLAGCASPSPKKNVELDAANEHIAKLEDKIVELETRLTALNDKINLENAEKPAAETKAEVKTPVDLPTQKVQAPAAAKNAAVPRPVKHPSKFAESFQQDEATDRYREAKILFDSNKPSDAILEFSEFVKDHPRHVLASNAQYYIGMAYLKQKEYKLAEEELSRVLINYPHSNAIPDTLVALVKVSDLLQKPARVSYFKEKLNSHFANSPQAKSVALKEESKETEKPVEKIPAEKSLIEKPLNPEPPTAPAPEMKSSDTNGLEPSVVGQ